MAGKSNVRNEEAMNTSSFSLDLENEKKNLENETKLPKLTGGKIFLMVLVGLISSAFICLVAYILYYNVVRYPSKMEEVYEGSGKQCIDQWVVDINSYNGVAPYLSEEITYCNNIEYRIDFIKKMVSTVGYKPGMVEALNVYGNLLLDKNDEVVFTDSLVNGIGEEVTLSYIDYTKVPLDADRIHNIMTDINLKVGDVDYNNKLIEVFCKYMSSLSEEEIPLVSISYAPSMVLGESSFSMTEDEDILLDKVLFSSEEFHDFLFRFSLVAGGLEGEGLEPRKEWLEWDSLVKEVTAYREEKAKQEELEASGLTSEEDDKKEDNKKLTKEEKERLEAEKKAKEEREEFLETVILEELVEPTKYDYSSIISMNWCGAYYLKNEYNYTSVDGNVVTGISAEVGDGSFDSPAGMNTSILTSIFVSQDDGNGGVVRVKKPVRVKLIDYKVSKDALDYFQTKDSRNRGFDIKSEIQYVSYTIEITNLSDTTLTIYDDTALCDSIGNISPRTGIIYGLQESVVLEPGKSGIIETWGSSLELNKKYLIWGSNFNKEEQPVWFRVLAGNVDDPSENKGVELNTSRDE